MKRSHKWQVIGPDVAAALASAGTVKAAALRLGISRVSLHRWIKQGRVSRPGPAPRVRAVGQTRNRPRTPAGWARAVRRAYELNPGEDALVSLAEDALQMSRDDKLAPNVRLAAMSRFQLLIRHLALPEEPNGDIQKSATDSASRWPRPA